MKKNKAAITWYMTDDGNEKIDAYGSVGEMLGGFASISSYLIDIIEELLKQNFKECSDVTKEKLRKMLIDILHNTAEELH